MYSCLKPKKVYNKYTEQEFTVSCRECEACQLARRSELNARIQREMLAQANNQGYFLTLTYDNNNLPIYSLSEEDGISWYSNRPNMPTLTRVEHAYRPQGYNNEYIFGHLYAPDALKFIINLRSKFNDLFRTKKKQHIVEDLFPGWSYENFKFRYYLIGEYGGQNMRPHYHLLVWFQGNFTREQETYLSQVISACWSYGAVYTLPITSPRVGEYLSKYVTSPSNLPDVLKTKSLKPFVTFSKAPVIGAYSVDEKEIQEILFTGVVNRSIYDADSGEFKDDILSPSFYTRNFPRCQGYNYKTAYERIRVYSYVYNYFRDCGVTHSKEELYNLRLCDIPFPVKMYSPVAGSHNLHEDETPEEHLERVTEMSAYFEEWSYTDKYASLVCYRYCVLFNLTPEYVLSAFDRLYSRIQLRALGRMYEEQEQRYKDHNDYYAYSINHDVDFLHNLPSCIDHLALYQYNALESYGIDLKMLYPSDELNMDYLLSLTYENDPIYQSHASSVKSIVSYYDKSKRYKDLHFNGNHRNSFFLTYPCTDDERLFMHSKSS